MDFIGNHTSIEHPWFIESKSSRNNLKRDWYVWKDGGKNNETPNNWLSVFGGSAWTLDKKTNQYYLHNFLSTQPDLNWRNKKVRNEMIKIMEFWLKRGINGFRIDALHYFMEDELYRDDVQNLDYTSGEDPYKNLLHIHSKGYSHIKKSLEIFKKMLKKHKDIFMASEAYTSVQNLVEMYKVINNKRYCPFNFSLISLDWKTSQCKNLIDTFNESLGQNFTPNYVISNHDVPRIISQIGKEKARLVAFLLFTLRGIPFIYYGDEIGMENVKISQEQTQDGAKLNKMSYKINRDEERTPMQWNEEKNAGFSKTKPWLPVSKNYKTINVFGENKDKHSFLSLYKKLIHTRNKSNTLKKGSYIPLPIQSEEIFSFLREYQNQKFLITINFSDKKVEATFPYSQGKILLNSILDKKEEKKNLDRLILEPFEGYIFEL